MKEKIISILGVMLFILLFSWFEGEKFFEFQTQKAQEQQLEQEISQKRLSFSLDSIRELEKPQFYYTPYKNYLERLVQKIDTAQQRVYIEVYMLTETRIQQSLINAVKRGVEVKVVLEEKPYKAEPINRKAFTNLQQAGVQVVWSNTGNYALNHTKILLIDNEWIVSTGNLTYSTFIYNRDFFIESFDTQILHILEQVFASDFQGEKKEWYDDNLILSPFYSREKLEKMIESATQKIQMHAQYLDDSEFVDLLLKKSQQGVQVEVVLSQEGYESWHEEKRTVPKNFQVQPFPDSKVTMHAKSLLIDGKYLFIGSVNISKSSFDLNREVGVLLKNKDLIEKFQEVFEKDFLPTP